MDGNDLGMIARVFMFLLKGLKYVLTLLFEVCCGCVSTLTASYQKRSRISPAKVHGKCHKSATRPARKMNESPFHASRAETGGRSYSDFTSRIKMDLIHIFPGPFAKASHFAL